MKNEASRLHGLARCVSTITAHTVWLVGRRHSSVIWCHIARVTHQVTRCTRLEARTVRLTAQHAAAHSPCQLRSKPVHQCRYDQAAQVHEAFGVDERGSHTNHRPCSSCRAPDTHLCYTCLKQATATHACANMQLTAFHARKQQEKLARNQRGRWTQGWKCSGELGADRTQSGRTVHPWCVVRWWCQACNDLRLPNTLVPTPVHAQSGSRLSMPAARTRRG